MRKFITVGEYLELAVKYDNEDTTVATKEGTTETVPNWMTPFANVYPLFNDANKNVYDDTKYLLKKFNYLKDFVTDTLIYERENMEIAFPYLKGAKRAYSANDGFITNVTEEQAYFLLKERITNVLDKWVGCNYNSVLRTFSALELDYNPIENYNREETPNGTKSTSRTMNTDSVDFIEVDAPATQLSITKDETTHKWGINELSVSDSKSIKEVSAGGSAVNTREGKIAGDVSITSSGSPASTDISIPENNGTAPERLNKITTFENTATLRNLDSSGSSGDTAQTSKQAIENSKELSASVHLRMGSPEAGWTETESYNDYNTITKGNIGVTTTQQMIDQEIKLRSKHIVDKFVRDLYSNILITIW